ncbi:hypothetical protein YC2023_104631 [Brassica napus]
MEAEKQIMRQQTILNTPGKTVSGHPPTVTVKLLSQEAEVAGNAGKSAAERQLIEDDNAHLAYWLTNTSALLFLLQKSLKTGGTGATASKKPPITTSLFGRMALSFRSSPNLAAAADAAALAVIRPVEAKYPALLFKQQLAAYVEKIFGMIRDNLKKELSALISLCIQVSFFSIPVFALQ